MPQPLLSTVNRTGGNPAGAWRRWLLGWFVASLALLAPRATPGQERATLKGHASPIRSVSISPDGRLLLSASSSTRQPALVRLWDLSTQKEIGTFEGYHAVFSPNGKMLATMRIPPNDDNEKEIQIWEVASGRERFSCLGTGLPASLAFSPDGRLLAIGSQADKNAYVWDLATGKRRGVLSGHEKQVTAAAFSPDGKRLATGSDDGAVKLWDLETGKESVELKETPLRTSLGGVLALAFTPDGLALLISNHGEPVGVWDLAAKKRRARLSNIVFRSKARVFHGADALTFSFSADGKLLAVGLSASRFEIYDMDKVERVADFPIEGWKSPTLAAITPDGKTIVTGSGDGGIRLWDVPAPNKK